MTGVWAVVLRGFPGEGDEVAAVFASHADAEAYAGWWNREELHRFGFESTATAIVEASNFHPPGSWRPPSRLSVRHGDGR